MHRAVLDCTDWHRTLNPHPGYATQHKVEVKSGTDGREENNPASHQVCPAAHVS